MWFQLRGHFYQVLTTLTYHRRLHDSTLREVWEVVSKEATRKK